MQSKIYGKTEPSKVYNLCKRIYDLKASTNSSDVKHTVIALTFMTQHVDITFGKDLPRPYNPDIKRYQFWKQPEVLKFKDKQTTEVNCED